MMLRTPLALLGLPLLGRGCQPEPSVAATAATVAPAPAPASAQASKAPLVRPATLPAVPAEPPPPTAPPLPGTPEAEGRVTHLVAIDRDRAIVRFIVFGPEHAERWWLALMRRDGSLAWMQTLAGEVASADGRAGIEVADDAVTLVTSTHEGDELELTLHAFGLADGARRRRARLGPGFVVGATHDGARRFDVRVHYGRAGAGPSTELIASTDEGVQWRAELPHPPAPGPDPTVIGETIVVRGEQPGRPRGTTWRVLERGSGRAIGQVSAEPQSCSDGTRWFVLVGDALMAVDPVTLDTQKVTGPLELPTRPGTWAIDDCTMAGGLLVAQVSRGERTALVSFDPDGFAPRGHVELGLVELGLDGFDPLKGEFQATLALYASTELGSPEILLVDPSGGRPLERWRSVLEHTWMQIVSWPGGYLVPTRHTLAMIDGRTGTLEGHAMIPEDTEVQPWQIAGSVLWLAPAEPMRLGARAPRQIDLAEAAADDVRGAVLADLEPSTGVTGHGGPPCPDPSAPPIGDGKGTDGTLGPVARTRLPTWDIDILHETARLHACAPGTAISRLLAWSVMEDERPLRNEYALMFVEDHTTEPPRFTLVHLYRHATNRGWNPAQGSSHSARTPVQTFDHRPTREEIDAYLEQSEWHFGDAWGRVLAGNVIDDAWRQATHQAPWRAYPKGIEQPD